MPYSVTQTHPDCDGYGVTKDSDGALMGCHQSEDDANKQIAALYAAEADQRAEVILVYGAPCSGKTTLANELAQRGDLILDRDLLYRGISGLDLYDHDLNLSNFVHVAWDALLRELQSSHSTRAIIQAGVPTLSQRTELSSVITESRLVYTERDICHARAEAAGRPESWHHYIDRWHDLYEPDLERITT